MAIAGNCSCISGIHAVHGDKKTRRGAGFRAKHAGITRESYPAEMKAFGRRAREVMPAAMRALVRTSVWYTHFVIGRFVREKTQVRMMTRKFCAMQQRLWPEPVIRPV
jgi:hypothetical protein